MNGESVSMIFDGTTTLANGKIVTASEEGSTVMIICKEISVTFDGYDVVVNVEVVSVAARAPAVLNGEVAGEVGGIVAGEGISEAATLEAILRSNIDVNKEAVSVVYDGSVAVVNGHPVVATTSVNF